jgi:hypothetical protein
MFRPRLFAVIWFVLNLAASCVAVLFYLTAVSLEPAMPCEPVEAVAPAVVRSAPSIESVQKLADLVTLRVHVSDILTVDQPGWLNGYRGAWIVRGDAECVTDLTRARIQEIPGPAEEPVVRIEPPKPSVHAARLDHSQTRTYDLRSKGWMPFVSVPESIRTEAMQRAQQIVQRTADREEYLLQAQRQTEAVLTTFYAAAGYRTEIVWHDAGWDGAADLTDVVPAADTPE